MLFSQLFAGDALLQGGSRTASTGTHFANAEHEERPRRWARSRQRCWTGDPAALPVHGVDSDYGSETAAAVHRFKVEVLGVPPSSQVIDDVGPQTVLKLDKIRLAAEQPPDPAAATVFVRQDVFALAAGGCARFTRSCAPTPSQSEGCKRNAGPAHTAGGAWRTTPQIHGMDPDPQDEGCQNQCQHISWFFLPWHRMYLFFFESICRSIIQGPPDVPDAIKATWALPYWDTTGPTTPAAAGLSGGVHGDGIIENPLREEVRRPFVNTGEVALDPFQTGALVWFPEQSVPGGGGAQLRRHVDRAPPHVR